jgi:DNA-binding transcriptional ArsR family regulator
MKYVSYDHFFTVLGNGQRVKILQYLNQEGPKSVSDICNKLKVEQSAVSHCLKQLLQCHFVEVKQQGKERIYSINEDTMKPLFNLINLHVETYCFKGCKHWELGG